MAVQHGILARMVRRGGADSVPPSSEAGTRILPEILPLGFGRLVERAAHATAGLVLRADRQAPTGPQLAEVGALLVPGALGLPLVDAAGGVAGLLVLDPGLVSALVEAQISGTIASRPPAERIATEVDAALCEAFAATLAVDLSSALPGLGRLRVGSPLFDGHLAVLQLPADGLRRAAWALDIGPGRREGSVSVILVNEEAAAAGEAMPAAGSRPDTPGGGLPGAGPAEKPDRGVSPGRSPSDRALCAPEEGRMNLRAVLTRQPISLAALAALRPGDVLALPRACLADVTLEAVGDRVVARVLLGAKDGLRAVCVNPAARQDAPVAGPPQADELAPGRAGFAELALAPDREAAGAVRAKGRVHAA